MLVGDSQTFEAVSSASLPVTYEVTEGDSLVDATSADGKLTLWALSPGHVTVTATAQGNSMYKASSTTCSFVIKVEWESIPVAILSDNADGKTKTLTFDYAMENTATAKNGNSGTYTLNVKYEKPRWIMPGGYENMDTVITKVVFTPAFAKAKPSTARSWFYKMERLENIEGIKNFNTSEVIDMVSMFSGCYSLKKLDVSNFNTSHVKDMNGMFAHCQKLTSLDLSGFVTDSVYNMGGMFGDCPGLTSLDVSHFNTSKVQQMYYMFYNCSGLSKLDISNFDLSNTTYIANMFSDCTALKELNLGKNDFEDISLSYNVFDKVGTVDSPCLLRISSDFSKSVLGNELSDSCYQWLGGYFTLDDPTQIISPTTGDKRDDSWYTLSGIKLGQTPPQSGIYIHNGKKTTVRRNK